MTEEFPKTDAITLNDGKIIAVIDYTSTPPPPEGMLRCLYCGVLAEKKVDIPYRFQNECAACIIEGSSMMGPGWAGWNTKQEKSTTNKQSTDNWLAKAIQLEASGQQEQSLDIIFDKLDDWLLAEDFDRCSSFLTDVQVDQLSTAQLLTILTVTYPAKTKLTTRRVFFDQVRKTLKARGENIASLLSGL